MDWIGGGVGRRLRNDSHKVPISLFGTGVPKEKKMSESGGGDQGSTRSKCKAGANAGTGGRGGVTQGVY